MVDPAYSFYSYIPNVVDALGCSVHWMVSFSIMYWGYVLAVGTADVYG